MDAAGVQMRFPYPPRRSVVILQPGVEASVSTKGPSGETRELKKGSEEFKLNLVEAFDYV